MLKATIDVTCYPVVKVMSKERPIVPRMALQVLEFEPGFNKVSLKYDNQYLLYFKEIENEQVI